MNIDLMFSSNFDSWTTPKDLFFSLDSKYHFTIDLCASDINHLCNRYYTINDSCLDHSWQDEVCFINPPYSRYMYKFVSKCYLEHLGNSKIVLLVPARTDTKWFHEFCYNKKGVRIEFIKGRLKFGDGSSSAPFPSMLVYFNL